MSPCWQRDQNGSFAVDGSEYLQQLPYYMVDGIGSPTGQL